MSKILIAVKEPHKNVEFRTIEDELENLQQIVGGYLEAVPFPNGLILWCNEEGKLMDLKPNFPYYEDIIVGNAFFTRSSIEGENVSLTNDDIGFLKYFFDRKILA